MLYRYVMIGGALNGRTYQLQHDLGPEFRLPPSDREIEAWRQQRAEFVEGAKDLFYPGCAPKPPKDVIYKALIVDVEESSGGDFDPDKLIQVRYCVPEAWGTDPERVAREMIRYFTRMNNAAADAVKNAGMITPEIVRLGKFVGIFHR